MKLYKYKSYHTYTYTQFKQFQEEASLYIYIVMQDNIVIQYLLDKNIHDYH